MFRKRKTKAQNLVEMLKKRPYHMFVTDNYIAVYSPALGKALIIYGNYQDKTELECNEILVQGMNNLQASMN